MSFPTRRQFTTSTQTSLTAAANTYTFSSTALAGNLLVIMLAGDKNTGTLSITDNIGTNGGLNPWVVEVSIPGASVSAYIAYKIAVGGENVVTATTSTASIVGNSGYGEEQSDDGSGAWTVVAKAVPTYDNTVRTSAASGTTDTADYDGRALALGAIDSQSSLASDTSQDSAPTFSNSFTRINVPARPSGSGGGNAGCYVGTKDISAGATTNTTFTLNAGAGDQLTCTIAVFGRVETTTVTGALAASGLLPTAAITTTVRTTGAIAGAPLVPTASIASTVRGTGALAAELPLPTTAITTGASIGGALAGTLLGPTASLAASVEYRGVLAGTPLVPTAAVTGTVRGTGALAGSLLVPTASVAADVASPGTLLRHPRLGVDKIALRLSGGSGNVRIDFSLTSDMASPISSTSVTPTGNGDAHVPIPAGLSPATTYYFRPFRGAYIGTVRSFTTLPGAAQTTFKFTFGSCRDTGADTPVLGAAIDRGAQLFLHLGDANYEDTNSTNASLYRTNDDEQYTHTNLTRALCEIPNTYVWSDHDFCGDSSTASSTGKATVRQVYRERVPSPTLPSATGGIYHTFTAWGGRVRFIALDTRSYRDSIGTTADGTMLGSEQLTWLQGLLDAADTPLTFIISAEGWHSDGDDDDWGFYQNERSTIAGWITSADTEVVFLCGDMHALTYATPANGTPGGVHVWHAAGIKPPFANGTKGGPYAVTPHYHGAGAAGLVTLTQTATQITATFIGLRSGTTDWSGTNTVTVDTGTTGALATTTPLPTASASGTVSTTGVVAAIPPVPAASVAVAVQGAGDLTGSLSLPTAALPGTITASGQAAGTLPVPAVAVAGTIAGAGTLAATLPLPVLGLDASGQLSSALAGVAPVPTGQLAGAVGAGGALSGALALPSAAFAGHVTLAGTLLATLSIAQATLTGADTVTGQLAASLHLPTAALRAGEAGSSIGAGPPVREPGLIAGDLAHDPGLQAGQPRKAEVLTSG